jgi:trehalose 6-phosphate phosphatase
MIADELGAAITELARTPRLLVTVDYDGVLAPIVPDPSAARPLPAAVDPLLGLAALADTTVALISGRARRDLVDLSGLPPPVQLVGSHGAEYGNELDELDGPTAELHGRLLAELRRIVDGQAGPTLEVKPASIAVHVRRAEPDVGREVLRLVEDGPGRWDGVQVTHGKAVIELAVVHTDKGAALDVLRDRAAATGAVFLGDDVTDEKAFRRLRDTDVGIKVGPGDSAARYRVDDPRAVAEVLALLLDQRRAASR